MSDVGQLEPLLAGANPQNGPTPIVYNFDSPSEIRIIFDEFKQESVYSDKLASIMMRGMERTLGPDVFRVFLNGELPGNWLPIVRVNEDNKPYVEFLIKSDDADEAPDSQLSKYSETHIQYSKYILACILKRVKTVPGTRQEPASGDHAMPGKFGARSDNLSQDSGLSSQCLQTLTTDILPTSLIQSISQHTGISKGSHRSTLAPQQLRSSFESLESQRMPGKDSRSAMDSAIISAGEPREALDVALVDDKSSTPDMVRSLVASIARDLQLGRPISAGTESPFTHRRYISWHEYFMSVALLAARRSKDPSTQVGACIVNAQNKIIATGYNGMPRGIRDDSVPWQKEGPFLDTKYAYVVHAELNAILNCVLTDQSGCRLYVTLFPCNECAKAVIQSGIRQVIYLSDKHRDKDSTKASKKMLDMAGISYDQYSALSI